MPTLIAAGLLLALEVVDGGQLELTVRLTESATLALSHAGERHERAAAHEHRFGPLPWASEPTRVELTGPGLRIAAEIPGRCARVAFLGPTSPGPRAEWLGVAERGGACVLVEPRLGFTPPGPRWLPAVNADRGGGALELPGARLELEAGRAIVRPAAGAELRIDLGEGEYRRVAAAERWEVRPGSIGPNGFAHGLLLTEWGPTPRAELRGMDGTLLDRFELGPPVRPWAPVGLGWALAAAGAILAGGSILGRRSPLSPPASTR